MNKPDWIAVKLGGSNMVTAQDFIKALETLARLIRTFPGFNFLIIFSALYEFTNDLEKLADLHHKRDLKWNEAINALLIKLDSFIKECFLLTSCNGNDVARMSEHWKDRKLLFQKMFDDPYDEEEYLKFKDKILAEGELITVFIISMFTPLLGLELIILDAKKIVKTDDNFGNATILSELTKELLLKEVKYEENSKGKIAQVFAMPGFIGTNSASFTTTVGREGSDYVAAIAARHLEVRYLYMYKKIGKIVNSLEDPKVLDKLTYEEIQQRVDGDPRFKIIHKKVIETLRGTGIPILITCPETGQVGTVIVE